MGVWQQTTLGWIREGPAPAEQLGYPAPGVELGLIERFAPLTGREVLEIGCASGRLTFQYARRARRVVALDPNEADVELARERAFRAALGNVVSLAQPGQRPPADGGPFDVAIFSWSL